MFTDDPDLRVEILTERQRRRPVALPEEPTEEELVRDFSLSVTDRLEVDRCRGPDNQIGFALQLCVLRLHGRFLTDFDELLTRIVNHLAKQLSLPPLLLLRYPEREATDLAHRSRIATYLGLQRFDDEAERQLDEWLAGRSQGAGDYDLYRTAEQTLRSWRVLLPAPSTLERLVGRAIARARRDVRERIGARIPDDLRLAIDILLAVRPGEARSGLFRLKAPPPVAKPDALREFLATVRELQELGVNRLDLSDIDPVVVKHLADQVRAAEADEVKRLEASTRYERVACFLADALRTRIDQVVEMNDQFLVEVWRRSRHVFETKHREYRQRSRAALATLVEVARLVLADRGPNHILAEISSDHLQEAVHACQHFLSLEEHGFQDELRLRYSRLRQYCPAFLEVLDLQGGAGTGPLLQGLEILRLADRENRRGLPEDAPLDFIPATVRPLLTAARGGGLDRPLYEMWFMWALKTALRSGDVFIPSSRHYASFWNLVLSDRRWEQERATAYATLALPSTAEDFLAQLDHEFEEVAHRVAADPKGATIEGDRFVVPRADPDPEPPSAADLRRVVVTHLPRVRIERVLVEVDRLCAFTRQFQPRSGHEASTQHVVPLLATLVAHGTNLGLATMAQSTDGITPDLLQYVSRRYVREETLKAATAELVNFHHRLPLARIWGEGGHSSSDGQRFGARASTSLSSFYPRYFGYYDRVFTIYTHVSDQHSVFGTKAISCSVREALYVLDGLLENDTILRPREHSTDTHGYTEHIFALCHLLGFSFLPRIRDLGAQRLYRLSRQSDYGRLNPALRGGALDLTLVREQWDPIVRLLASLRERVTPAHVIVQRLAEASPSDRLARAVSTLGRIFKTLFVLRYVSEPVLRQRIHRQLNRGEQRHALARVLFFGNQGEFRTGDYEEIMNKASCRSLLSNAVLVWNTVHVARVADQLRAQGATLRDEDLARISPPIARARHSERYLPLRPALTGEREEDMHHGGSRCVQVARVGFRSEPGRDPSEPGRGTTFKVYLPRVDEPAEAVPAGAAPAELPRGQETILLVEDTETLREVIQETLEDLGYTVLLASNGEQALAVARAREGPIDLLLTDVVMPKLGGGELARLLMALRPGLHVLYMSGYANGAISQHGVLGEGVMLLEKPFTGDRLARAVREALDRPISRG